MKRRKESHAFGKLVVISCLLCVANAVLAADTTVTFTYDHPTPPVAVQEAPAEVKPPKTTPTPKPPKPPKPRSPALPTKAQKDATESVCRKIAVNRQGIYTKKNVSPELFTTTCYYDLLAIAYTESRFNCLAVGDGGKSRGCFQIQTKMHGVSIENAENYEWAALWTMDRMVRDTSYPNLRTASITRHNGSGDAAATYALSVKSQADAFERAGL